MAEEVQKNMKTSKKDVIPEALYSVDEFVNSGILGNPDLVRGAFSHARVTSATLKDAELLVKKFANMEVK